MAIAAERDETTIIVRKAEIQIMSYGSAAAIRIDLTF